MFLQIKTAKNVAGFLIVTDTRMSALDEAIELMRPHVEHMARASGTSHTGHAVRMHQHTAFVMNKFKCLKNY